MSFDISALEPQIRAILSAPGTDLATISAKSVRRKLLEVEPSLTAEFLKEHKEEVGVVIGRVFEVVSAEAGGVEVPPEPRRERANGTVKDEVEEYREEEDEAPSRPSKKPKKAGKKELSDAELARQLSNQINGRARRSGTANGSSTKKKRTHKSADFIDSDSDDDDDGSSKRKRKSGGRKSGGGAKGGFAKEYWLRFVAFDNFLLTVVYIHFISFLIANLFRQSSVPRSSPGLRS
jgi:upstream activation factor subunit UAF30